jgi:hypothetical protein
MKKVMSILTVAAAVVVAAAMPSPTFATCATAQFLQHSLVTFQGCPDATPVAGYAYVLGNDATMNTVGATLACSVGTDSTNQFIPCQPDAGTAGDGFVTIQYDWGGASNTPSGALCPNTTGDINQGRNVVQVVANDGSSVIVSVGFEPFGGTFYVDAAHPDAALPLFCSNNNGLGIQSHTSSLQADTFCVNQTTPPFFTDCDPGSGGLLYGTCAAGTPPPAIAPGTLYTRTGACNSLPDARKSAWTPLSIVAGPGGSKCVTVTRPSVQTDCAFIGGTSTIGGIETSAMTGSFRVQGLGAASDKVAIKKAELLQGKLRVDFGTENETAIVGFNVYAGSSKLNSGLIQAKGTGSNDYSFEVGRGALKNERSVTVEAVKSDGTSVRSSSVSLK